MPTDNSHIDHKLGRIARDALNSAKMAVSKISSEAALRHVLGNQEAGQTRSALASREILSCCRADLLQDHQPGTPSVTDATRAPYGERLDEQPSCSASSKNVSATSERTAPPVACSKAKAGRCEPGDFSGQRWLVHQGQACRRRTAGGHPASVGGREHYGAKRLRVATEPDALSRSLFKLKQRCLPKARRESGVAL